MASNHTTSTDSDSEPYVWLDELPSDPYKYPLPTTIPDCGPLRYGDDAVEGFDY